MIVKKNSIKSSAKRLAYFIAIAISIVFLSSCNVSQSSSNNNEQTDTTIDTEDNQNTNTGDSPVAADQGEIEIYAGPGSDYYYEGKIHYSDVHGIVLEDHEWLEVKYNNNQHGYITRDTLEEKDLSNVPLLVDTIPVAVGGRKYLETADFQYRLSGDIDLFEDTDALNKTTMVEKGNVITIVAPMPLKENKYQMKGGSEQELSYWLIEAITERGKERAYVGTHDLFDLDNPLKDFSSVKENNLKLVLGNDTYYSSSDDDYFKDDWEIIKEFPLTHTEWNFWEGFLSVITSSDVSLEDIDSEAVNGTKTAMPTLSKGKRTYTNTYTSLEEAGPISPETASALLWLAENILTFFNESKQTQSFNVSLQQCKGENRLVIHTGVPIESMQGGRYYGKDFTLLELLLDRGYTLLTAADAADEYIRSLDSSFNGEKKYAMSIHFARQGKEESPYGMRIIIDKEGNAYGSIILHQGTYFRITYDNKVVKDITKDIESSLFQLDNNTTSILLELLEKSGFEIIKRESVAAEQENEESANYTDNMEYANNMEIPVGIYTYFYHYSDSKKIDINDPYTFWMMLSFYATMQMDDEMYPSGSRLAERYLDDEYGQMLILSEEEVRDAVNAMMPDITEYPAFPDSQYLHYYKKNGDYYFPLIDLDAESARMTDIKVNDDGTATAIAEAFSYRSNEIYETYQVNLIRNDKINPDSPEPYPFGIESIIVISSGEKTETYKAKLDELVGIAREEHLEGTDDINNSYNATYQVPEILIDSPDAADYNKMLKEQIYPQIDDSIDSATKGMYPWLLAVDYSAYIFRDTLTVVTCMQGDWDISRYYPITFDLGTGRRLDRDEVSALLGLDSQKTEETIANTMGDYYGNLYKSVDEESEFFKEQYERTIAPENVEKTVMYPSEDGTPYIACTIYSLAGAESYDYCIPLVLP